MNLQSLLKTPAPVCGNGVLHVHLGIFASWESAGQMGRDANRLGVLRLLSFAAAISALAACAFLDGDLLSARALILALTACSLLSCASAVAQAFWARQKLIIGVPSLLCHVAMLS